MHTRFWIVADRQTRIRLDAQNRLHDETGPARAWGDGWALWSWHGVRVPRSLIEDGWTFEQIMAERNAEIRRCAIERTGWDKFTAHMTLVSECDDPGNDGQTIGLYELPAQFGDMFADRARILLCVNGTVERDGTRRRFGLPVPARHDDPLEAATEMYGWPVEAYRRLEVRR